LQEYEYLGITLNREGTDQEINNNESEKNNSMSERDLVEQKHHKKEEI